MPTSKPPVFNDLSLFPLKDQIEIRYYEFVEMIHGSSSDEGLEDVSALDPEETTGIQNSFGDYTLCYTLKTDEGNKKRYVPVDFVRNPENVWWAFQPALQLVQHYTRMTNLT